MTIHTKIAQGRNELCKCGSGLKFKRCHGDISKRATCERVMVKHMVYLIMREKHKRKLITDDEWKHFWTRNLNPGPITEADVGEILDKARLKRCAGALCSVPIPDTENFCPKCKSKIKRR